MAAVTICSDFGAQENSLSLFPKREKMYHSGQEGGGFPVEGSDYQLNGVLTEGEFVEQRRIW